MSSTSPTVAARLQRELQRIYSDLQSGALSKQEAFSRISALKLEERLNPIGRLLAIPVWEAGECLELSGIEYARREVVLCGLREVSAEELAELIPGSSCVQWAGLEGRELAGGYSECAAACFEKVQGILRSRVHGEVLLQIVVAQSGESALLGGLSGLLRTAALENPQLHGQLILSEPHITAAELASRLQGDAGLPQERIIRHAPGVRQVQRWRTVQEAQASAPVAFKDRGVYLISGGLGGLGMVFAQEILEQTTQGRVILTGRAALTGQRLAKLKELGGGAQRVEYRQLEIVDLRSVQGLIAGIEQQYGQLNGILHCAGMTADNFILKKTAEEFSAVLAPKVTGAVNLDRASRSVDLDFLVLFSSIAGAMGNVGQADYAAANGFLDMFAVYRNEQVALRGRGGHTVSINWPLWEAGGMRIDPARRAILEQSTGALPMRSTTGLGAFYRTLMLPTGRSLVLEGDPVRTQRWLSGPTAVERPDDSAPLRHASVEQSSGGQGVPGMIVPGMIVPGMIEKTEHHLCKQLSAVLKLPLGRIDPRDPFENFGIDSILAMKLTDELEKTFGSLPKTLFFEHQSIRDLTAYFVRSHPAALAALFRVDDGPARPADAPVQPRQIPAGRFIRPREPAPRETPVRHPPVSLSPARSTAEPIAIIGLSGRYPQADTIEEYWRNLREGRDCIVEVPPSRWDWREYYSEDRTSSGHHYSRWGGFIEGVDEFDPLFFSIPPRDAKYIDPQERLFLQHAWMAVEDAGYTRAGLQAPDGENPSADVGVYVGVMYSEYQMLGVEASMQGRRMGIFGSLASIANRVSYCLNLHGPSIALDTMCSSSLTAIHLACQDLRSLRTRLAIAGGVNVSIHPNKYLVLSAGQFISSDGQCQSFGEGGDGYIPAEGVGAVVLKRYSEAVEDGDHIYGILRGSALSHGGRTNGYTVPNPRAQAAVIRRALNEANVEPQQISYIETHGTGTKLGDPIEVAALDAAFGGPRSDERCPIGSVKSNIGHGESAAGIAGLTKVLLQMHHRQIAPSLHSTRLNPGIDFSRSLFVVNQTLRPWDAPMIDGRRCPRIAGVSSFGAGGANAHLIVEEGPQGEDALSTLVVNRANPAAVLLSARTEEQLKAKVRDLLEFIRARPETDLGHVAYTLQVGREAMDERLAVLVSSSDELILKLGAQLNGEPDLEGVYRGNAKRSREMLALFNGDADLKQVVDKWTAKRSLTRLLDLWVKGLDLDWQNLYRETKPRRVSLPSYPFAREHHWFDPRQSEQKGFKASPTGVLHPLVHRNTSTLGQQSYCSTFTGKEFFLVAERAVAEDGKRPMLLPAEACLEMVRAAVELALAGDGKSKFLELREIIWGNSFRVAADRKIEVALTLGDGEEIDYEIYSRDAEREIVHCQGSGVLAADPRPTRLAIGALEGQMGRGDRSAQEIYAELERHGASYRPEQRAIRIIHLGERQLVARLQIPSAVDATFADYGLHPSLIGGALQAGLMLVGAVNPAEPLALRSLRIMSPCGREPIAWVRYAVDGSDSIELDIDLCDEHGNVLVEMRGMGYANPAAQLQTPRAISVMAPVSAAQIKPAIALVTPESAGAAPRSAALGQRPVALSDAIFGQPERTDAKTPVPAVEIYDHGNGALAVKIGASEGAPHAVGATVKALLQALKTLEREPSLKVLIIVGGDERFLFGDEQEISLTLQAKLCMALASFPYPVIAAMPGGATGTGFLAAALCDFMICGEEGRYRYGTMPAARAAAELDLLEARFGAALAHDLLSLERAVAGTDLRAKGWTCPIVPQAAVLEHAQGLASLLTEKAQEPLRLLKGQLMRRLLPRVLALEKSDLVAPALGRLIEGADPFEPVLESSPCLDVEARDDGVVVIRIRDEGAWELSQLLSELTATFASAGRSARYGAVVLAITRPLAAGGQSGLEEALLQCLHAVLESPIPVVAALQADAGAFAWLLAHACDHCIYNELSWYVCTDEWPSSNLSSCAAALFAHRLGDHLAKEILLTGARYSGAQLQQRARTVSVARQDEVLTLALQWAASRCGSPREQLIARKTNAVRALQEKWQRLPTWLDETDAHPAVLPSSPTSVPLRSEVVTATAYPDGILVVRMEDRHAKNMFSSDLVAGVDEVFAHIECTSAYKVVVLTGYDDYFACGGTRESLLAIQQGAARFTDVRSYEAALRSRIPVIAAMQGHGIGAGWVLGMLADFTLFSEDAHYLSPYMNYGFTPGAGSTLVFPERVGYDLARETLLTAQRYSGRELQHRGLSLTVLPQDQVYPAALELARQIARRPRSLLVGLKRQFNHRMLERLNETYQLELDMHAQTFVGRSDTLNLIRERFMQVDDAEYGMRAKASPLPTAAAPSEVPASKEATASSGTKSSAAGMEVAAEIAASLKNILATELQMADRDIDEEAQFVDLGLDSISGVTFIRKINERYGVGIEATKIYGYPTLRRLSGYVSEELRKGLPRGPSAGGLSAVRVDAGVQGRVGVAGLGGAQLGGAQLREREREGVALRRGRGRGRGRLGRGVGQESLAQIAVIGMAGQFPGAKDIEQYWRNIASGRDCIEEVSSERWDVQEYYRAGKAVAGKTNSRWLGALEEYDRFDPLFFSISPSEAEAMDPQQRLFLQACWQGIEHAGYDARVLSGSKCGVFVGCASGDYYQGSRQQRLSAQGFTGGANSILAARISYFLNLQGPSLAIDTACSSSLVAIANACDSLRYGGSDMALAGGVYVMAGPEMHIRTAQAGMLSAQGRCYVFDQRANGFVPGEAVGVVVLKRLADAQRDRDTIYGVIRGWGVNQDGKTNGITAPNPAAQARLQQEVYERHGIDPGNIGLIEAHGTGTQLGDPIELQGLKESFGKYTAKRGYCALGSVKSNIGHCLTAAGVAGLIKLVMALRHRQLPPTIHFERLNEHIELEGSPFYINSGLREWQGEGSCARQGAVSAFGFSGTNAHVVVEEYQSSRSARVPIEAIGDEGGRLIVPLSARTREQLHQRARDLLQFIGAEGGSLELMQLSYTLQVGRQAMEERVGFLAASIAELAAQLNAYVNGEPQAAGAYQPELGRDSPHGGRIGGIPDTARSLVESWIAQRRVPDLLRLWVNGLDLDWNSLYGDSKPQRISLPGYPFAKERYWIDASEDLEAAPRRSNTAEERLNPIGRLLAIPVWEAGECLELSGIEYARREVVLCGLREVSAEELAELIPGSSCVQWAGLEGRELAGGYSECAAACFEKVQGILRSRVHGEVLLQIVVAQSGESALLGGLSGLLRTAALENPQLHGQLILSEPHITAAELASRLQGDAGLPQERIIRHAPGVRQVQRWRTVQEAQASAPVAFKDRGVYLISGGLGGLGMVFAQEILEQTTQGRVILTGRAALTGQRLAKLKELGGGAQRVEYRQLEIVDLRSVQGLIAGIEQQYGQLNGILHCAGMTADNFILKKTAEEFSAVLAPKVTGAVNLDRASRSVDLDFLVLFSSIAGAMGNVGQADYAAANGFLDMFAVYRNEQVALRGRGGHTVSINWPLWEAGGMRIDPARRAILEQSTGALPMRSTTGLGAFYRTLMLPTGRSLVIEGVLPKVEEMLRAGDGDSGSKKPPRPLLANSQLLHEKTLQKLKELLGRVIKLRPERIDAYKELSAYGIDSLMITRLNDEFAKVFAAVSKTLFFEYKSLATLTAYLIERHAGECESWTGLDRSGDNSTGDASTGDASTGDASTGDASTGDASTLRNASSQRDAALQKAQARVPRIESGREPIAIIGLSGIYPQAATLAEYWDNLRSGKDCITEIPVKRWPLEGFFDPDQMRAVEHGRSYCKWGGFIDQFDQFDSMFFGISPREALSMDPQERIFLQAVWHALESAGYTRLDLQRKFQRKVGVFAGITKLGFNLHGSDASRRNNKFYPHTSFSSLANRVSYFLDITGPSMPIDTMCSSSLTAIHEACEHIHRGECALAFAGGVNLYLHSSTYIDMAAQYALCRDGKCRSFGAGASGFVPGEGVGAVLLKPLAAAIADNDNIHGLILATHVNHGGKTNGYTVPNPRAQAELIRQAIAKAGISARDVSYIEAHGTGTELGDPIEIEGLRQVFEGCSEDTGYCRIGSAKSSIGHLEAAAGVAGLTKVLLQMKHTQIAPSLNAEVINPGIRLDGSPFVLNRALTSWEPKGPDGSAQPRIAGISSFGAGGANAHVLVQEFVAPTASTFAPPAAPDHPVIVPLSAKTPDQLRQVALALLDFLTGSRQDASVPRRSAACESIDLSALAYTLQVGREALDERLAFIVESTSALERKLSAFVAGDESSADTYRGGIGRLDGDMSLINQDDDMQQAVSRWLARRKVPKLAELWVNGLSFDWDELYGDIKPRRLDLPTYPFSEEKYWIDTNASYRKSESSSSFGNVRIDSLEDILEKIEGEVLECDEAVDRLKVLM